jgi:hypothetical protein
MIGVNVDLRPCPSMLGNSDFILFEADKFQLRE